MGIIVTLRRGADESPFKQALLKLCSADTGGGLLLCSGYIWEESVGGYSISNDGLSSAIYDGVRTNPITLIAGKLGDDTKWPYWETKYSNFIKSLQAKGLIVQPYIAPDRNWHAKVAVRFDSSGLPVCAIVGSSNLTGPAYRENYGRWNYEADVIIYAPGTTGEETFQDFAQNINDDFGKMFLSLNAEYKQPNEILWLKTLVGDAHREDEGPLIPFEGGQQ